MGTAAAALAVAAVAVAAAPALAAQHLPGPAASHGRAGAIAQHLATGRMTLSAPWAHIAAGAYHTCGIRADGTLWCWGDNSPAQLGIGSHTGQNRPRQVTTPATGGWATVTAASDYTCATRADGTLWCWGDNSSGQLGLGPGGGRGQDLPRQVTTPAQGGWASVATGAEDTCGTRTDATLWCWGYNGAGELGIGNLISQGRPRQVTTPAPGGWATVTTGSHTCATRAEPPCGAGASTTTASSASATTPARTGRGRSPARPRAAGPVSPPALPHLRHPHQRHPVVLGVGLLRPARHRQPQRRVPPAADHHPSPRRLGQCHRRRLPHLRHPHQRHPVVLGLERHRPARHRRQPQHGTASAGHHPGRRRLGQHHRRLPNLRHRTDGTLWCWGWNVTGQLGIGNYTDADRPRQVIG